MTLLALPDDLQRYLRAFLGVAELVALVHVSLRCSQFPPFRYEPTHHFMTSYFYSNVTYTRSRYCLFSCPPYHPYRFYQVPVRRSERNSPTIEIVVHNEFRRNEQFWVKLYRPFFPSKSIRDYLVDFDPGYDTVSRRIVFSDENTHQKS